MDNFKELEIKLYREIANNDVILFNGLSAFMVLLGISYIANQVLPTASLGEFSKAVIVSMVWLIVRQELMMHRAGGYLEVWRKVLDYEERDKDKISPGTMLIRPQSWDSWRTGTWFRLLTLIISDLLTGTVGFLLLFRSAYQFPKANWFVEILFYTLIVIGLVMIPITIVFAKKDPSITFNGEK